MTTITVDTDGTSGDYSSLAAAVAALPDPLTDDYTIECSASTGTADTLSAQLTIDVDTESTYRLTITRADSNYELETPGSHEVYITGGFDIVSNITFEGLVIKNTSRAANYDPCLMIGGARDGQIILDSCWIEDAVSGHRDRTVDISLDHTSYPDASVVVVNCVLWSRSTNGTASAPFEFYDNPEAIFYNNTIISESCNAIFSPSAGVLTNTVWVNNLFDVGSTDLIYNDNDTLGSGSDYNASTTDDLTGGNDRTSQTFTFVDAANGDFHLASGDSGARGHGTDLSSDATYAFSDDYDGESRSSWDIGAFEYTSGTSSAVAVMIALNQFSGGL